MCETANLDSQICFADPVVLVSGSGIFVFCMPPCTISDIMLQPSSCKSHTKCGCVIGLECASSCESHTECGCVIGLECTVREGDYMLEA